MLLPIRNGELEIFDWGGGRKRKFAEEENNPYQNHSKGDR